MNSIEKKAIRSLIKKTLQQKDIPDANFQQSIDDVLKKIDDAITAYGKDNDLTFSTSDRQNLIKNELRAFVSRSVSKFYQDLEDEADATNPEEDDEDFDEDAGGREATDDPTGPNW
jgi:hypothetical protein